MVTAAYRENDKYSNLAQHSLIGSYLKHDLIGMRRQSALLLHETQNPKKKRILKYDDMHELMFAYELKERLTVCLTLIEHLKARKETRWHSFDENLDYPEKSDEWLKYVNSKKVDGEIKIITRQLVGRGESYEHNN